MSTTGEAAAKDREPTIQDVVDSGMSPDRIRDVVNGIARGIRARHARPFDEVDVRMSLDRIADALDYIVALSKEK
jgi:hypothetical protein